MAQLLQSIVNGFSLASLYLLVALSITLVFGLTGVVNFSVGQFVTLAAFGMWALVAGAGVPFALAALIVVVGGFFLGGITERVFFRRTLAQPLNGFIVSLGLILVIGVIISKIWGTEPRNIPPPVAGVVRLGDVSLSTTQLVVFGVAVVCILLLVAWLRFSRNGLALRGAAQNREAAQLMGVPAVRLSLLAFSVATALMCLAGALLAGVIVIQPDLSSQILIKAFAIAIIGGLGNVGGAVVAGVIVALAESLAIAYLPTGWAELEVFILVVLVLVIRPRGIVASHHG